MIQVDNLRKTPGKMGVARHVQVEWLSRGFSGLSGNEPLYLPNRFQDVLQVITVSKGCFHSDRAS